MTHHVASHRAPSEDPGPSHCRPQLPPSHLCRAQLKNSFRPNHSWLILSCPLHKPSNLHLSRCIRTLPSPSLASKLSPVPLRSPPLFLAKVTKEASPRAARRKCRRRRKMRPMPSTKLRCARIGLRLAIVTLGTNANLLTARLSKQTLLETDWIRSSGPRTVLRSSTRSYACMASAAPSATSTVLSKKSTDSTTGAIWPPLRASSARPNPRLPLLSHTHLSPTPSQSSPRYTPRARKKRSRLRARPAKGLNARTRPQTLSWALRWLKTLSLALRLKKRPRVASRLAPTPTSVATLPKIVSKRLWLRVAWFRTTALSLKPKSPDAPISAPLAPTATAKILTSPSPSLALTSFEAQTTLETFQSLMGY